MDTSKPGPLLQIAGGALMIIGSFLKWGGDTSGLSTDFLGLLGIFALIFGAVQVVVGLAGSVAPQIALPRDLGGLEVGKIAIFAAAAIFLWTFGMITVDGTKVGLHLTWIGAAAAEVGGFMRLRTAEA